ncbi:hypothetical protein LCGC14_0936260 [marine sediment metagenome]|uniref:Uncharacterized protein n=1 Tax=marine sediment metagenome TaxID=412755 RepID=A0A0F9P7K1_9ZZZZ
MEPEIIAVLSTIIATLIALLGKMGFDQRNNHKPRNEHQGNPGGVVDLHNTKLGDMSAGWYEAKHKEILDALENLAKAVRGETS